jgi:threonine/homoserine/homoserine lactone efflux protein
MTAVALGVATVLLASAAAFTVLKLVGAAYLVFLGAQAINFENRQ